MNISKRLISGTDVDMITIEEKEANLSQSEHFKKLILQDIRQGSRKIIISFSNVEYVDSSFLGALVAILKELLPHNGKLVLIGLNDDIVNLFQLTRLDKIFILKNDLDAAIKEF
ncbi:MAG TPA: STAS domain-containing protein [Pedobacter sp.]|nr:STAS domain-containing protein [Pedobacter sp.]